MKKIIVFTMLSCLFVLSGFAQIAHDLEIFSEDGLNFTLFVNGKKMNEIPQANVQIINIENEYVQVKIKFEDSSIPDLDKKIVQIASPGTEEKKPMSVVYKIKEKKGVYKLRFVSRSDKMIQNEIIIVH